MQNGIEIVPGMSQWPERNHHSWRWHICHVESLLMTDDLWVFCRIFPFLGSVFAPYPFVKLVCGARGLLKMQVSLFDMDSWALIWKICSAEVCFITITCIHLCSINSFTLFHFFYTVPNDNDLSQFKSQSSGKRDMVPFVERVENTKRKYKVET